MYLAPAQRLSRACWYVHSGAATEREALCKMHKWRLGHAIRAALMRPVASSGGVKAQRDSMGAIYGTCIVAASTLPRRRERGEAGLLRRRHCFASDWVCVVRF